MSNSKLVKRTELHKRAWSEPISSLAKEFGISDVGLAKTCRKLEVPLPPRGWWARKSAGKPATGDFRKVGTLTWEYVDPGDGKLIREIAIALAVKGEEILRASTFAHHEWWLKRRTDILAEREKARREAERKERERQAALERRRVEHLLGQAEALRNAGAIRAFVEEVRATHANAGQKTDCGKLNAWSARALAQVDPTRQDGAFDLSAIEFA